MKSSGQTEWHGIIDSVASIALEPWPSSTPLEALLLLWIEKWRGTKHEPLIEHEINQSRHPHHTPTKVEYAAC
jgi:hypothetical protein